MPDSHQESHNILGHSMKSNDFVNENGVDAEIDDAELGDAEGEEDDEYDAAAATQ